MGLNLSLRKRLTMENSSQAAEAVCSEQAFDEIVELAERAISYWRSVALAAERREQIGVSVHLRQSRRVGLDVVAILQQHLAKPATAKPAVRA